MKRVTVLVSILFCVLTVCLGARDLTMMDYASGEVVVDATIITLDAMFDTDSNFWTEGDDSMFFKTLALVESSYGENEETFTVSHLGGIWQIMQTAFDDTQDLLTLRRNSNFQALLDEVSDVLDITWSTVTFEDLVKPLHSLVAARLVLHLKAAGTGSDPEDICTTVPTLDNTERYGQYWYECYREEMSGSVQEFEERIDPEVCDIPTDVMFVLDSSGSINYVNPDNWNRIKYFTGNFTQGILGNSSSNQVGVITYSYFTTIHSDLTNDRDSILSTIADLPYEGYTTNTAHALCRLLEINWREESLKLVILMTDGQSNSESPDCGSTIEAPKYINALLCPQPLYYVIGVTDNVNPAELDAIATSPQYIDNLDSFENTAALSEFRRHRTYQICFRTSSFVCEGAINKDDLTRGDVLRYQVDVAEGVTIRLCVGSGQLALYASADVPTPSQALNTFSFEDGLLNAECEDLFVDLEMLETLREEMEGESVPSPRPPVRGRKRQVATQQNVTIFITIEAFADNSSFVLETIPGNSSKYSRSCDHSPCGVNTVCTAHALSYSCTCQDGYEFESNFRDCKQINECARYPPPCDPSALCADTVGSFLCTCYTGYVGDGLTCTLDDNSDQRLVVMVICGVGGVLLLLAVLTAAIVTIYLALSRKQVPSINNSDDSIKQPLDI